jgi:diacylglycerol kinase (ATP)
VIKRLHEDGHDVWNLSGNSADLALEHVRRAVASGVGAIVVVGGDGMVHLGIQEIANTNIPLGIVPVGTGNDFATVMGLPVAEPTRAVANLTAALHAGAAGVRRVDLIRVTGKGLLAPAGQQSAPPDYCQWVAGAVSAGLDAAINARANAMLRPQGASRYFIAALRELASYRSWPYNLTIEHAQHSGNELSRHLRFSGMLDLGPEANGDGHRLAWHSNGALVTAANSSVIGGGIVIAPKASLTDGFMDLVLAGEIGKMGATKLFPQMMSGGKHADSDMVRIVRCRAVNIQPGEGAVRLPAAYADGEYLGTLPLRAETVPGALRVLVAPQGN